MINIREEHVTRTDQVQEELRRDLEQSGRSVKWLADKIGYTYHNTYYMLNLAKEISLDEFIKVKSILSRENIGLQINETRDIQAQTLKINSSISQQVSRLNMEILHACQDGKLSSLERKTLVDQLESMVASITDILENLKTQIANG